MQNNHLVEPSRIELSGTGERGEMGGGGRGDDDEERKGKERKGEERKGKERKRTEESSRVEF